MTPLAMKIAKQLCLPVKDRSFWNEEILGMFGDGLHCFDISAISDSISNVMDEDGIWREIGTTLPAAFLPSPITWLEWVMDGERCAVVLQRDGENWSAHAVIDGETPFGMHLANLRSCPIFVSADRIEFTLNKEEGAVGKIDQLLKDNGETPLQNTESLMARKTLLEFKLGALEGALEDKRNEIFIMEAGRRLIGMSFLALDLINTPGLVGFRQHAPHKGLAKQLSNVGSYPLRSWSEVVVKTKTKFDDGEYESGDTYHKCLHFVRSHSRRFRDGTETIVCAHWRGDPALGIKRTRYRVAA